VSFGSVPKSADLGRDDSSAKLNRDLGGSTGISLDARHENRCGRMASEVLAAMMRTLGVLALLASLPAGAFAQAVIAGAVRDPSGAAVPGVAVETTSNALIENARTTVTDSAGRYRVENLRPGIYHARFSLPGWKTHHVDGVDVSESITAIVDVQLAVGDVTETVSVTASASVVNVQSAQRAVTLTGDVLNALPTARTYNALLALVPGVTTSGSDTVVGAATISFPIHGGRDTEGRLLLDGLNIGSPPNGNSATSYALDVGQAEQVTFLASGGLGESETAGLVMNIVPKSGGNATRGTVFVSGTGEPLQSDNLTPELHGRGVIAAPPYTKVYDVSAMLGGRIVRDRLWYFVNAHSGGSTRRSTSVYYNRNAGDAQQWRYTPDLQRPAYSDRTFESASGRLTWQATPRNKLSGFWDVQSLCRSCSGATPGLSEPPRVSPEAVGVLGRRLDVTQATWSSPVTDHLLIEAGYGGTFFGVGNFEREPNPTRNLIRVIEQCASGCAANGNIPGLAYRSQDFSVAHAGSYLWKGSVSYVTGSQTIKVGYQRTLMTDDRTWMTNDQALTYRLDNGLPNQLTQSISPWVNNARAGWDAWFAQQQWTWRRLTLQGAMRFDRASSWFPAQGEGPSRFLPVPIVIPETRGIDSYKDITPRFGVAYDVAGTGRTAITMSLGKYLDGVGTSGIYANTNPTLRMPRTTPAFGTPGVTRTWTDANGNFVPDCDLMNPGAQDLRGSGGDFCGGVSNVDFGKNILTNAFDAGLLSGWGVRPSDWSVAVSLLQQIGARSAMDVTYSRRTFRGFTVVDNMALEPSDLTPFSIVAPLDSRLPGGGGYIVEGLYDAVPSKAGQVNNLVVASGAFGRWYQYFNGLDVTVQSRIGGLTMAGGTSSGQTVADNCDVRARLPELSTATTGTSTFGGGLRSSAVTPLSPYCHVAEGILTHVRGLATYLVPKFDIELATTIQSRPGGLLAANYAAPNAVVEPSLRRSLSGNAPNVTVNLIAPGTLRGDRVTHVDVRIAKVFRHGRFRTVAGVDVHNLLNSSAILTYDNTFVPGGPWLQPLTVQTPRLLKVTAALDW
jgi:hypothetical protein